MCCRAADSLADAVLREQLLVRLVPVRAAADGATFPYEITLMTNAEAVPTTTGTVSLSACTLLVDMSVMTHAADDAPCTVLDSARAADPRPAIAAATADGRLGCRDAIHCCTAAHWVDVTADRLVRSVDAPVAVPARRRKTGDALRPNTHPALSVVRNLHKRGGHRTFFHSQLARDDSAEQSTEALSVTDDHLLAVLARFDVCDVHAARALVHWPDVIGGGGPSGAASGAIGPTVWRTTVPAHTGPLAGAFTDVHHFLRRSIRPPLRLVTGVADSDHVDPVRAPLLVLTVTVTVLHRAAPGAPALAVVCKPTTTVLHHPAHYASTSDHAAHIFAACTPGFFVLQDVLETLASANAVAPTPAALPTAVTLLPAPVLLMAR
jgi:hypothetical protein